MANVLAVILLLLLVAIVTWVVWRWSRVSRYWAERGIPHDPPHLILGSLTFLQRQNPALWMRHVYKKFKTPYVGVWLFWRPALIINDPEMAKRILVKDSENFRDRFLRSGKSDPIGSLNVLTLREPLWSTVRRRLTVLFTAAKLRNLDGLIQEKSRDLVERYTTEMLRDPQEINVRVINADYTTDIIGEAAFGVRSQAAKTGDSVIRKITRDFMRFDVFRGLSWSSIFFFPSLVDVFGFSLFPKDTTAFMGQLFRNIVKGRGGFEKPIKDPKDLLDALIKMRQDAAKEKEDMSEDLLLAQAAIFLQAGFDTAGAALTWAFKELAHAPYIQEKLYMELADARENLGRDFDAAALAELPYLNAVIKETLRKYPPMGWLDRMSSKDYKLDDNFTIPSGMPVYVNGVGMMMDPEFFPDPEVFDPERFMPENEKNIKPFTYMPFGEGPRICVGKRFANINMRYGLAAVALNFEICAPPDVVMPNNWPVERQGMLFMPSGQVKLEFKVRK